MKKTTTKTISASTLTPTMGLTRTGDGLWLVVLMGIPGSGKTTWCSAHAGDISVVSVDAIKRGGRAQRVFSRARSLVKLELARGHSVIIDSCATRWRDRAQWVSVAGAYGAKTRLVVLDTPSAECARRDACRKAPVGRTADYAPRMDYALRRIYREPWDEIEIIKWDQSNGG